MQPFIDPCKPASKDSDSEGEQESQADEDEDSALSTLAGHDDAESAASSLCFFIGISLVLPIAINAQMCANLDKVESSSSAVTPPMHIPALSGEMQSLSGE